MFATHTLQKIHPVIVYTTVLMSIAKKEQRKNQSSVFG